jgi:thiol-disulfide isomerase/thioredoxin
MRTRAKPVKSKFEILDFYSDHCGQCRRDANDVARLAAKGWKVTKINVPHEPKKVAEYNVTSMPTYIVLCDGKEVFRTHSFVALRSYLVNKAK